MMEPVRCLSLHATYRCRDSGVCCSSGWPIPIEIAQYERLVPSLSDGSIGMATPHADPFLPTRGLPDGAAAVLGQTPDGRCVFHDPTGRCCRIQRVHGHAALPIACQQFPRMCLIDPRGVHVTLSHYCPTAADLLFHDTPLAIVHDPPAFPPGAGYEGLDARQAFPPLLRPGVLMDWHTLDVFETHAISIFAQETHSAEAALARLDAIVERLRAWQIGDGPLLAACEQAIALAASSDLKREPDFETTFQTTLRLDAEVRGAVPARSAGPSSRVIESAAPQPPPQDAGDAYRRLVDPAWRSFTRPLCRYLAAKLFANWCWYQGQGLRTLMRALQAALAVLRIEAARQTLANGRMLDRDLLRDACRRTDLLLMHLCAQDALARGWAAAEQRP